MGIEWLVSLRSPLDELEEVHAGAVSGHHKNAKLGSFQVVNQLMKSNIKQVNSSNTVLVLVQ